MKPTQWIGAAAALMIVACGGAALAGMSVNSELIETATVRAPRGFTELCDRRPEVCPSEKTMSEVDRIAVTMTRMFGAGSLAVDAPELTPERYTTLQRVNAAVNASIRPVEDLGPDLWAFSPVAGDCEEYVLMKREMLARLGWPRAALRITVVRGADYQYHAVLVVTTKGGDLLLDNMAQDVSRVDASPYDFVVSQSLTHPGDWVRVHR